jgi:hypothetical protein
LFKSKRKASIPPTGRKEKSEEMWLIVKIFIGVTLGGAAGFGYSKFIGAAGSA